MRLVSDLLGVARDRNHPQGMHTLTLVKKAVDGEVALVVIEGVERTRITTGNQKSRQQKKGAHAPI